MTINHTSDGPAAVPRRPILHLAEGAARSNARAFDPLQVRPPRRFVKGAGLMSKLAAAVDLT